MRHFERVGTIYKTFKNVKNAHGGVMILVKLQAKASEIIAKYEKGAKSLQVSLKYHYAISVCNVF